jgi:glycosyltransferase involved in cell wall biosynthesis
MKLLYFSRDYTTHDHRFLSALANTAHEVFYLRLERRGHQLEDRPLAPQIRQIRWAGGRAPVRFGDGLRLLHDLRRVIGEIKPDIIQAGPLQRSAFLVALAGFQPLLSVSWGYDLILDAQKNAFWRWATRFTLKRSTMMLGDCNTIRQLAVAHGMPNQRIVTFPWGVDLQHFSPPNGHPERSPITEQLQKGISPDSPQDKIQDGHKNRPFTLISTRGWEPIYGVDVIARAFVSASRRVPNLRLVMLGNGSQAGLLHRTFMGAGLAERVVFPGQVGHYDLPRYYRKADLYLSASHSDGSSISLLEAMACGTPALVSDIPGNREWVTPGKNGWLFPDGDDKALANAIIEATERRRQLVQMGLNARKVTEKRADWLKNFKQLLNTYEKIKDIA